MRSSFWPWLGGGIFAGIVLVLLHPALLLTRTVPAGFDFTGHIYPLWIAVHELIPRGRIHGWDLGWFAGFPIYYFYFPLPALLTALLTPVAGFLPAAKIVSALGMVVLPLLIAWFVYRAGAHGVVGFIAVLVGSSFLLMQSYSSLGGNIASGLAGEFAYGLGFALSLAYLCAIPGHRGSGRAGSVLPAILLAATALAHVICVAAAVLGSLPLLGKKETRSTVVQSWILGFMLAAFWAVPFLVRLEPVAVQEVVQRAWYDLFHPELLPLLPVAVGGAAWASRHAPRLLLLAVPSVASLLFYAGAAGHAVNPGRMLPYFFLTVHLFAGVGAGVVILRLIKKPTVRAGAALAAVAVLLAVPHAVRDISRLYGWTESAYSGLNTKRGWAELEHLIAQLRRLPPGRVYWQLRPAAFAARGSRQLFTLLPYWSPDHAALRGLWAESSPLTETLNALDRELAVADADPDARSATARYASVLTELGMLGARYFLTVDARGAELVARTGMGRQVATVGEFVLFELPAAPLVTATGHSDAVSALTVEDMTIRFQTTAPGVPHVIRVGHFANWRATGAAEVVRLPSSLMSVVPEGRDVVLRFRRTWAELTGTSLSLIGVLWLVWLGLSTVLARRQAAAG